MILRCDPVIMPAMRGLCVHPYPGHPRGCPNYGRKPGCPPNTRLLSEVYDLTRPCWLILNAFNLGAHVRRMKRKHPEWSDRQLVCCLYWQGTARKQLEAEIKRQLDFLEGVRVERCPEAMGLNVTATLAKLGIVLEWPPRKVAHQVAFAGTLRC